MFVSFRPTGYVPKHNTKVPRHYTDVPRHKHDVPIWTSQMLLQYECSHNLTQRFGQTETCDLHNEILTDHAAPEWGVNF